MKGGTKMNTNKKFSLYLRKVVNKMNNRPEQGKIYALTGGIESKCIANGYGWLESIIKEVK